MAELIVKTNCHFNWQGFSRTEAHNGYPNPRYEIRLWPQVSISIVGSSSVYHDLEPWTWELDEYSDEEEVVGKGIFAVRHITYTARYRPTKEPWELKGLES